MCTVSVCSSEDQLSGLQLCGRQHIGGNSGDKACHPDIRENSICKAGAARDNASAAFLTSQQHHWPYRPRCYFSRLFGDVSTSFLRCALSDMNIAISLWR